MDGGVKMIYYGSYTQYIREDKTVHTKENYKCTAVYAKGQMDWKLLNATGVKNK